MRAILVETILNNNNDDDFQNKYKNNHNYKQYHIVRRLINSSTVVMEPATRESPPSRGRSSESQQHLHLGTVKLSKGFARRV